MAYLTVLHVVKGYKNGILLCSCYWNFHDLRVLRVFIFSAILRKARATASVVQAEKLRMTAMIGSFATFK